MRFSWIEIEHSCAVVGGKVQRLLHMTSRSNVPVSHIWAFTVFPSTLIVRVANSTPIVDLESKLNSLRVKRESTLSSVLLGSGAKTMKRDDTYSYYRSVKEIRDLKDMKVSMKKNVRFADTRVTNQHNLIQDPLLRLQSASLTKAFKGNVLWKGSHNL